MSTATKHSGPQQDEDKKVLEHVLDTLLVLKDAHLVGGPIKQLGVHGIHDIISLSKNDIRQIVYQNLDNENEDLKIIPPHAIGMFLTLKCLHHFCASNAQPLNWTTITRDGFRAFQVSPLNNNKPDWVPMKPIITVEGVVTTQREM